MDFCWCCKIGKIRPFIKFWSPEFVAGLLQRTMNAVLAVAVCFMAGLPCAQAFGPGVPVPAAPAFLRRSGLGSAVRNDGPVRFSLSESPRANAHKCARGDKACTAV
jgi:hypothetical protein